MGAVPVPVQLKLCVFSQYGPKARLCIWLVWKMAAVSGGKVKVLSHQGICWCSFKLVQRVEWCFDSRLLKVTGHKNIPINGGAVRRIVYS